MLLDKFLCCCELQTGALIIGIVGLVGVQLAAGLQNRAKPPILKYVLGHLFKILSHLILIYKFFYQVILQVVACGLTILNGLALPALRCAVLHCTAQEHNLASWGSLLNVSFLG